MCLYENFYASFCDIRGKEVFIELIELIELIEIGKKLKSCTIFSKSSLYGEPGMVIMFPKNGKANTKGAITSITRSNSFVITITIFKGR